jgi:transposase
VRPRDAVPCVTEDEMIWPLIAALQERFIVEYKKRWNTFEAAAAIGVPVMLVYGWLATGRREDPVDEHPQTARRRRMGRPSKLTEPVIAAFAEQLRAGHSMAAAAAAVGIHPATLHRRLAAARTRTATFTERLLLTVVEETESDRHLLRVRYQFAAEDANYPDA